MSNEIKKNEVVKFIRDGKLQVCALIETHLKQNNINRVGNKVFDAEEHSSGISHSPNDMNEFKHAVNMLELEDFF
ncbi:hypothetical protein Tco_1025210 [Tanacetum coccineum]